MERIDPRKSWTSLVSSPIMHPYSRHVKHLYRHVISRTKCAQKVSSLSLRDCMFSSNSLFLHSIFYKNMFFAASSHIEISWVAESSGIKCCKKSTLHIQAVQKLYIPYVRKRLSQSATTPALRTESTNWMSLFTSRFGRVKWYSCLQMPPTSQLLRSHWPVGIFVSLTSRLELWNECCLSKPT